MNYVIATDSTVDLGEKRIAELGVPYVRLSFLFDGTEYPDDMTEDTAKKIYNSMREGKVITTSQVNADQFIEKWTPILSEGNDILYIGFSTGLSGTVNSACIARDQLKESFPEREIFIVDSLCASGGEGMLLQHALIKKQEGLSAQENYNYIESIKLNVNHWFTVGELQYLRRGGRVSAAAAFVADILGIKPVLNMDNVGHLTPREKVKGRKASIKRMFEHMTECVDENANPFFHITHSDCLSDAEYLKNMLQERYPQIPVYISMVGAVIGSHCGPGTLALFFLGKPRTA